LLLLGDQVYADDVPEGTRAFIAARRDPKVPPGMGIADFEEYAFVYRESWREPQVRWLLSTVSSSMMFDDHEVNDDWNISESWVAEMRRRPWWDERIVGAFMSYWLYQHLGNLSPDELDADPLLRRIRAAEDGGPILRRDSYRADRTSAGARWAFRRDLGRTRVVMLDGRAARVLHGGRRDMIDEEEWRWVEESVAGDFDHLLVGTSIPYLLAPGMHHLQEWNEAVCAGAWGPRWARLGEWLRRAVDLEHWAAFRGSFERLGALLRSVARGERGTRRLPEVGGEEDLVLLGVQVVVDAEVAEVEERVAHAGVLPVDNPDPLAVVDEVGVQKVVVAWARLDRCVEQRALNAASHLVGLVPGGWPRHAASNGQRQVGLDDAERNEEAGDRRTAMDATDRIGDTP